MMAATAKYRDDIAGAIVTTGTPTSYQVTSYQDFDTLAHRPNDRLHAPCDELSKRRKSQC
jgi:hypothetical protein